jgi:hypothetical protein
MAIGLDQMLRDLFDENPDIKKMAARAILKEAPRPDRVLGDVIREADKATLEVVLDVLFNAEGDFTGIFSELATHPDATIRARAIRYLFRRGAFSPADAVNRLGDPDPYVRRRAISYLFWMNDAPSLAAVSRMCSSDPDESVRKDCLRLVSIWGSEQDVEQVVKALEDPSPEVRLQAVQTLRRLTGEDFGDPEGAAGDEFEWIVAKWQGWWELTRKRS